MAEKRSKSEEIRGGGKTKAIEGKVRGSRDAKKINERKPNVEKPNETNENEPDPNESKPNLEIVEGGYNNALSRNGMRKGVINANKYSEFQNLHDNLTEEVEENKLV